MTFHHTPSEMSPRCPSDDRLIDYLLGESSDECAPCDRISDAAIERWLASDEANVRRLELFAASVLTAAVPQSDAFDANAAPRRDAVSAGASAQPAVLLGNPRAVRIRAAAIGLLALAATVALAVFWSRPLAPDELSTRRVAIAWAEAIPTQPAPVSIAGSELDASWSADWESLDTDDWLATDDTDESEAFAADHDSPPQWLLTALAQMSSQSDFDLTEAEAIP